MGLEIERKFLIKSDVWKKSIDHEIEIKQGYLNTNPERTVRVRIKGNKGILTIKGITINATRSEYEYEIPLKDAEALIELCEKPIIEKKRFILNQNKKVWEIDVFSGENKGLVIAEIELESENEVIEIPEWIGQEVTLDSKYYNSSLIKHPFSKW